MKTSFTLKLILISMCLFVMTGCGKDAELENYKANMNQFFENVRIFDSSINSIDPDSETAVSELLALLDSMDTSFAQMASLEVPDGFPGVEELADEASSCMSEAVSYYHQAYEGEYNASLEDAARQNYKRANEMLQYIVSIFHGDIPEEIYTYDDETEEIPENPEAAEE
ncbi:MAG: hypothetical protein HDQ97_08400 [Lachnospiraceae bacterium]|nr:hypothetical protein [Lachnospiraceae bacterium]